MTYLYLAVLFIFGTILGSFYTVYVDRLCNNLSIIKPGSHCDHCNRRLKCYELVPIISYIFLLGKCPSCKNKISIKSTIVELITGLIMMVPYYFYGFSTDYFITTILATLTLIIFLSDFKYMIILDSSLIVSILLLSIVFFVNYSPLFMAYRLYGGLILFLIIYLIKTAGDMVFKEESLGGGDVKLGFILGLVLGLKLGLISFAFSAFIALPYAMYITNKKERILPFGPFIILSVLIIYIFKSQVYDLLTFLLH